MSTRLESLPPLRNVTARPASRSSSGPAARCRAIHLRRTSTPYAPTPTPTSHDPKHATCLQVTGFNPRLSLCSPDLLSCLFCSPAGAGGFASATRLSLPRGTHRDAGWHPALHRLRDCQSDRGGG